MKKRVVSFAGQSIAINYDNRGVEKLLDFLFHDLPEDKPSILTGTLRLHAQTDSIKRCERLSDNQIYNYLRKLSLYSGDRCCYNGSSPHALAETLINETIFKLIRKNRREHMFHAAALAINGKGILLPGQSGAGKSTLAAWLASNGFHYLSDELIAITRRSFKIDPFTRPISLKLKAGRSFTKKVNIDRKKTLTGPLGLMIPHRLLNPEYALQHPSAELIVFPQFEAGKKTRLTKISGAQCGIKLLSCHVNARNLTDHGFFETAILCKTARSYTLTYGDYDNDIPIIIKAALAI